MDLPQKLAAARTAAAVGPVEGRGVLRLAGRGALDFLHRMSTQHLSARKPGDSAYAAFLEGKGHVVGEALVVVRPDDVLLLTEPAEVPLLVPHLRKYVLASPVKVEDVSASLATVAVLGPDGVARARALAGGDADPDAVSAAPSAADGAPGDGLTVASTPRRGAPGAEAIAPPDRLAALRDVLVAGGAAPLDAGDLEALRVEAGIARFGADVDAERLPMEAALTRDAIHFEKGCYLGQEVVLRATVRGHVQRGLVQLVLPPGAGPGTPLTAGDREVGWVTTAAETSLGRLGLGYLRRAHWREGETLRSPAGEVVVRRVLVEEPA